MDKKAIIKIIGFLTVPFLIMLVAMFFLYPKMNKEKYEEIVNTVQEKDEEAAFEESPIPVQSKTDDQKKVVVKASNAFAEYDAEVRYDSTQWKLRERQLFGIIDSLYQQITQLESELDSIQTIQVPTEQEPDLDSAEFSERVKSLLNLEEDELSPILEKMDKKQLIRLYLSGGTLQREKILKSLKADEAADLMREIMK